MKKTILFGMIAAAALFSCNSNNDVNSSGKKASEVSIFLTDAPSDWAHQSPWKRYAAVNLDVAGVKYFAKDSLGKDSVWKDANFTEDIFNVSLLSNGDSILLSKLSVQAGETVHKIKFILGKNSTVALSDNTVKNLLIPEKSDSSIIIKIPQNLPADKYTVMLDFDIAHSIIMGRDGNFYLIPVMRGFIMEKTAAITGLVLPQKLATKVFIVDNNDTIATVSDVKRGNMFKLSGIEKGSYKVQFMPLDSARVTCTKSVKVDKRLVFLGSVRVTR